MAAQSCVLTEHTRRSKEIRLLHWPDVSNASPSEIEINVHLEDGRMVKFVQKDTDGIRKVLAQMHPEKVFSHRFLVLGDDRSMSVFPSAAVARLDLVTDSPPEWRFHHNVQNIQEITEEELRRRYRPESYDPTWSTGRPTTVFGEIELVNGERLFYEARLGDFQERLPMDLGVVIQQIFSSAWHARRLGGGFVLVNPANILRLSFYPGIRELPLNGWHTSRQPD